MRSLPLFAVPEYRAVLRNGLYCFGPMLATYPAAELLLLAFPETYIGALLTFILGFTIIGLFVAVSVLNIIPFFHALGGAIGRYHDNGYDPRDR